MRGVPTPKTSYELHRIEGYGYVLPSVATALLETGKITLDQDKSTNTIKVYK